MLIEYFWQSESLQLLLLAIGSIAFAIYKVRKTKIHQKAGKEVVAFVYFQVAVIVASVFVIVPKTVGLGFMIIPVFAVNIFIIDVIFSAANRFSSDQRKD